MSYDKASFQAGLALGRALWRPPITISKEPSENECLTFIGASEFSLSTRHLSKYWSGTVEYSTDADHWAEWFGEEVYSKDKRLYLRGTGNRYITSTAVQPTDIRSFVLKPAYPGAGIRCRGNINTLLNYEEVMQGHDDVEHINVAASAFTNLFRDCTALVEGPSLSKNLYDHCYNHMFHGCSSLTRAPSLLATRLYPACYQGLFTDCTSLRVPPKLTTETVLLQESCFGSMFYGCTALEDPPVLPPVLQDWTPDGYRSMTPYAYADMFNTCTSLRRAPRITEAQVRDGRAGSYTFLRMFQGCRSLHLSDVQQGQYQYEAITLPQGGNTSFMDMFKDTAGPFVGTPVGGTAFYSDLAPTG